MSAPDASAPALEVSERSELTNPAQAWSASEYTNRISLIHPSHRAVLDMAEGVQWQRLAATPETAVNFMKISYAPGSTSTAGGEMLTHEGYEYGYVLEGELEVTVGGEVFSMAAGQSIGFDSSIPHIFRNPGTVVSTGIWFVHGNCNRK